MYPETDSPRYLNGICDKQQYIPNGNNSKKISSVNKQSCQYDVDNNVEEKLLTRTENGDDVHIERSLGLISGTAIIVGTMIVELTNYTDSIMKLYRIIARILVNIALGRILYCTSCQWKYSCNKPLFVLQNVNDNESTVHFSDNVMF
jgi:hypothetical protein